MTFINTKIFTIILLSTVVFSCDYGQTQRKIRPAYFSEIEIKEPRAFYPEELTTVNGISFTNDGNTIYTSESISKEFDNGRKYAALFESGYDGEKWTKSVQIDLGINIDAYHPVLSMDNKKLFFNSRSHLDSMNKSIPHNIWFAEKTSTGWGIPKMVANVNSTSYDSYPSLATNNNLYFNSDREGGMGSMDLYVSKYVDGHYQQPINITALNSADSENDLVIDPDERFIIFNRYFGATNELDLFISFRNDSTWSKPRPLDNINSADEWELTPSLSPDGKYFFYELKNKIMQVELASMINVDAMNGFELR